MRLPNFLLVLLLGLLAQGALAQKQPNEPLETGFERKLGVVYKTIGQRELAFDLYYPEAKSEKPFPTIIYTHGGGWAAGNRFKASKGQFATLFKALIERGFCIVSVSYRLCRKGSGIRMRDCVIDSKDALRYVVKNSDTLNIDRDRILVFGDSAGGHIAQMLVLTPPETLTGDADLAGVDYKIAAGLSWYGPCSFEDMSLFNHDDRPNFNDRFEKRIVGDKEVTPEEKQRLYREISPTNYLKKDSPPLLVIQGDKDTTIPVKHAYQMAEKARENQALVETLIVKNAGHNWRKVDADLHPSRDEIIDATVAFFVAHTREGAAETRADFYMSPDGSDKWSGTLAEPNPQRTDGPFATLEQARDAVRAAKKEKLTDVVVLIREGTYSLDKTVVFGLEDSGESDATVTYAAYPGELPVFSAGREIKGWKKVSDELPGLPKKAQGNVFAAAVTSQFYTLYDAEGMLPRARSAGFIPRKGGSRNRLHFPKGKLRSWRNIEDVEIMVRPHHAWISNILPLASVDEEKQIAHTSIAATYAMNPLHFLKTTDSCWVENVLEELDEPGEWVLNTKEGRVYLWPRGESPVLAPQLIELLRIDGELDKKGPRDRPARNLRFRGLTFMHGDRYTLADDDAGLQHDWDMLDKPNALVRLRGTENCSIEHCHFTHSGSGAIRVDLHAQKNKISSNHIENLGGGGILLCGYGPGTKDVNQDNLVDNNHIHHSGRVYWHSPGIMLWQSGENRVANNLIHHMPYSGMIISGCVTQFFKRNGREVGRTIRRHEIGELPKTPTLEEVRPYLHTHDNLIRYNEIHHVMEKMGDGNGIYIRGAGADNVIRRNYIHHLVTPMQMQAAIRTDGGQRDTLIAENLIYKCMAQGIILKLNNRAENNIVADVLAPPRGYYLSLREGPLTGATIKRNIFYSTGKETTFIDELPPGNSRTTEDRRGRVLARAKDADTDYNLYYSSADPALGTAMLAKQQGDGVDANSLAIDPLFVDPDNGDFSFKPDSPALKLSFVPFDRSKAGLRTDKK